MFEWARQTTGDINLARTMAIQALVAGRIVYLLSISQLGNAFFRKISGKAAEISDFSAIAIGILCTVVLQVIFSQWS